MTLKTPSSILAHQQKPEQNRCSWCLKDPLYVDYHDNEWGRPIHDDRLLYEFLVLEGMQAGLSWLTILLKRENFRIAFEGFHPKKIAAFGPEKVEELLQNSGIIRNRKKIESAIHNAKQFLDIQKREGSFNAYIWQFVGGKPIINHWESLEDVPCFDSHSDAMAKALKREGFAFVGTKICYSFMQATGMVNDHLVSCFAHLRC